MWTIAGNLLVSLGSLGVLLAPTVGQAAKVSYQAEGEQQVLVLLNQIRHQRSLGTLLLSTPLRAAARAHSADMLQNSYFDHDSPGETWDTRIARYLRSPMIGENIAWGTGSYGSPEGLVNQWMDSAPHRRIILSPGLHRVGLGIAVGTFDGTPRAVMATADFAA
jgi:uncharacterized protein YkwD